MDYDRCVFNGKSKYICKTNNVQSRKVLRKHAEECLLAIVKKLLRWKIDTFRMKFINV